MAKLEASLIVHGPKRHGLPELIVGVLGIEEHTLRANLQRFKQHAELLAAAATSSERRVTPPGDRAQPLQHHRTLRREE